MEEEPYTSILTPDEMVSDTEDSTPVLGHEGSWATSYRVDLSDTDTSEWEGRAMAEEVCVSPSFHRFQPGTEPVLQQV